MNKPNKQNIIHQYDQINRLKENVFNEPKNYKGRGLRCSGRRWCGKLTNPSGDQSRLTENALSEGPPLLTVSFSWCQLLKVSFQSPRTFIPQWFYPFFFLFFYSPTRTHVVYPPHSSTAIYWCIHCLLAVRIYMDPNTLLSFIMDQ